MYRKKVGGNVDRAAEGYMRHVYSELGSERADKRQKSQFMKYAMMLDIFVSSVGAEGGLSANTVSAYMSDLKDFGQFVYFQLRKEIRNTTKEDIRSYIAYLCGMGIEATSLSRKLSSIKRLYSFLVSEGQIRSNPSSTIESPKIGSRLPKYSTDAYTNKMIEECRKEEGLVGTRDELIIEMLYTTGLRVSELVQIQTRNMLQAIDHPLQDGRRMLLVMGKGQKERFVPIKDSVARLVQKYLEERKQAEASSVARKRTDPSAKIETTKERERPKRVPSQKKFLFPNGANGGQKYGSESHITRETVWAVLKKRARLAGVDPSLISPHVLRHSFATNLCGKDVSVRFVQELLGHSSISTTEIYLHTLEDNMADFVEANHPLAKASKQKCPSNQGGEG